MKTLTLEAPGGGLPVFFRPLSTCVPRVVCERADGVLKGGGEGRGGRGGLRQV